MVVDFFGGSGSTMIAAERTSPREADGDRATMVRRDRGALGGRDRAQGGAAYLNSTLFDHGESIDRSARVVIHRAS